MSTERSGGEEGTLVKLLCERERWVRLGREEKVASPRLEIWGARRKVARRKVAGRNRKRCLSKNQRYPHLTSVEEKGGEKLQP